MTAILLSPHNDDESLFASAIILRYKPEVVICTDSWIQKERGQDITAAQRIEESCKALDILGATRTFLGIRDTELEWRGLVHALMPWPENTLCFAPALQGGNPQHDLVSSVADNMFMHVMYYATYAKNEWYTPLEQGIELVLTDEERKLKMKALDCYTSQHFQPHFMHVRKSKSEWVSGLPS